MGLWATGHGSFESRFLKTSNNRFLDTHTGMIGEIMQETGFFYDQVGRPVFVGDWLRALTGVLHFWDQFNPKSFEIPTEFSLLIDDVIAQLKAELLKPNPFDDFFAW